MQTTVGTRSKYASKFKIQMPEAHQNLWIKIRTELIMHLHNRLHGGKFSGGMSTEYAKRKATQELHYDLIMGELRISLEDMLTYSNDECLVILENYKKRCFKEMIDKMGLKRKGDVDCD